MSQLSLPACSKKMVCVAAFVSLAARGGFASLEESPLACMYRQQTTDGQGAQETLEGQQAVPYVTTNRYSNLNKTVAPLNTYTFLKYTCLSWLNLSDSINHRECAAQLKMSAHQLTATTHTAILNLVRSSVSAV